MVTAGRLLGILLWLDDGVSIYQSIIQVYVQSVENEHGLRNEMGAALCLQKLHSKAIWLFKARIPNPMEISTSQFLAIQSNAKANGCSHKSKSA